MQNKPNFRKSQMDVNIYNTTDYENKSNWTLGENKPKQSQGIKRVSNIFRDFILTFLTQSPHINITTPIVDRKRDPSQNEQKEPEKNQVSVLTMGVGIFSSFFFAAGM
jgi:hypothetical protein